MKPQDPSLLYKNGLRLVLAGIGALVMVGLQACTTDGGLAKPKYPVYMQDRPAEIEAAPAVSSSSSSSSSPAAPSHGSGSVSVAELPPPPPPPPPAEETPPAAKPKPTATATSAAPAPVADTRAGFSYVLQAHDTLYGVSRRFGVPVKDLYQMNDLSPTAGLRVGQKVLLPPTAVDKGVEEHANGVGLVKIATAKPAAAPAKPVVSAPAPVAKPVTNVAATKPAVTTGATTKATATTTTLPTTTRPVPPPSGFPANSQISQMGRGLFVWPVRGRILVPFGQLAPNVRNDGINVSAAAGTEIKASADGVVVYEGDQVKELGNTVYIKHANGWYTGYSHLQTMAVKNNEHVAKGQVIGTVGQTGVVDQPQLHFEVRYTPSTDIARPVDPTLVLPQ